MNKTAAGEVVFILEGQSREKNVGSSGYIEIYNSLVSLTIILYHKSACLSSLFIKFLVIFM